MKPLTYTKSVSYTHLSLAHKLGGEFHIPHGRANAVILPYVIAYNAQKPTKFVSFPKYGKFVADYRYAQIARFLNLGGTTQEEQVQALIDAIRRLMKELNMPIDVYKRQGVFCLGHCTEAVSVKIGDSDIYSVSGATAENFFNTQVLPLVES